MIKIVENTVSWAYAIVILTVKKLLERFMKKIQKPNQKEFRV